LSLPEHWFEPGSAGAVETSDRAALPAYPLVSVHMITYNHEAYIAQAIEGVIAQEVEFPIELIIGDDCSTDGTRAIVDDYQKRHPGLIRIISSASNVGPSKNVLRLIEAARGEFIAFCEGDDYWCDPKKLQMQVDMMRSDLEIGCVHTDFAETQRVKGVWKLFYPEGVHKVCDDRADMDGRVFDRVFSVHPTRFCTVMYRTSLVREFIESEFDFIAYTAGETALLAHCAASWSLGYIDRVMVIYRVTPGSLSRQKGNARLKVALNRLRLYLDFEKVYGDRPDFDHRGSEVINRDISIIAFRAGERWALTEAMRRLVSVDSEFLKDKGLRLRLLIARAPLLHMLIVGALGIRERMRTALSAGQ
jgi:glycosyltransferase involved in cell wall biosynthesis